MKRFTKINLSIIAASLLAACGGGSSGGGTSSSVSSATASKLVTIGTTSSFTYQDTSLARGYTSGNFNAVPTMRSTQSTAVTSYVASNYAATSKANKDLSDQYYNNFNVENYKSKSFAPNVMAFIGIRAANMQLGRYVTPTQLVTASKYNSAGPTVATRYNLSSNAILDGSGTAAAIVDGVVKVDNKNFASKPTEVKYYTDTHPASKVTTRDLQAGSTSTDTYLGATGNHATYTALTITGKGGTEGSGLAPKASLTFAQLYANDIDIGAALRAVFNDSVTKGKPVTVINNSYSISTPNSVTATGQVINNYSQDDIKNINAMTTSLQAALNEIANKDNAPLMVFATGNYNYRSFLKTYVDYDYYKTSMVSDSSANDSLNTNLSSFESAYASVYSPTIKTLTETQKSTLYEVDYGKRLAEDSALTKILNTNDKVADNLIAVTGYYLDRSGLQSAYQQVIKEHIVKGDIDQKTADQLAAEAKAKVTTTNDSLRDSAYISNPGAVQCGVIMYSCLAASYSYVYPYDASTPVPSGSTASTTTTPQSVTATGTSFAAPQVSATALLVKQQFPWMTARQLKETILTTARDIGAPGVDPVFGWGVLDVTSAVNGPGAFIYGDFVANLGKDSYNYYFNNNIGGNGGLIVNADNRNPSLYLSGRNTYTGNTVVNGGNLVLMRRSYSQTMDGFNNRPSLASNVYVNSRANLFAYYADLQKNVQSNGLLVLNNTAIGGNLTTQNNSTLVFDMNGHGTSTVAGKATLNGQLVIANSGGYIPSASSSTPSSATKLLSAGSLTTNFSKIAVTNNALVNTKVYTKDNNLILDVVANSASAGSSTLASSVQASETDANLISLGASNLDTILAAADKDYASSYSSYTNYGGAGDTITTTASLASSDNTQDTITQPTALMLAADASNDTVATQPATQAVATSSNSSLAGKIQALTTEQQAMLALSQSGVSYAILSEIAAKQGNSLHQEFVNRTHLRGALTAEQIRHFDASNLTRGNLYFLLDGHNSKLQDANQKHRVDSQGNGYLLGYSYKLPNSNAGIALSHNSGEITQKYTGSATSQTLATGNYSKYGVTANYAYFLNNKPVSKKKDELVLPRVYLGTTVGADYTSFSNHRQNSYLNTQLDGDGAITGLTGGLFVGGQYNFRNSDGLNVYAGVNWANRNFKGFTETARSYAPTTEGGYQQLALTLGQQSKPVTTAYFGADYGFFIDTTKINKYAFPMSFELGVGYSQDINTDGYSVTVASNNNASVASPMLADSVFQAKARVNFWVSDITSFYLSYTFNKSSNYKNNKFNLGFNYGY